jgi:hypothetical protein
VQEVVVGVVVVVVVVIAVVAVTVAVVAVNVVVPSLSLILAPTYFIRTSNHSGTHTHVCTSTHTHTNTHTHTHTHTHTLVFSHPHPHPHTLPHISHGTYPRDGFAAHIHLTLATRNFPTHSLLGAQSQVKTQFPKRPKRKRDRVADSSITGEALYLKHGQAERGQNATTPLPAWGALKPAQRAAWTDKAADARRRKLEMEEVSRPPCYSVDCSQHKCSY